MDQLDSCLFCKIVRKQIPAEIVFESQEALVIRDIHPQAKIHLLVIPKKHYSNLTEVFEIPTNQQNGVLEMGSLLNIAVHVAAQEGFWPPGFRTVINTGKSAGQTVFHLHIHLLGGEPLRGDFA